MFLAVLFSILLLIKAIAEWLFPSEHFMKVFFCGLDKNTSYDYKRFRVMDISISLFGAIVFFVFILTHNIPFLIIGAVIAIASSIWMSISVRKPKKDKNTINQ